MTFVGVLRTWQCYHCLWQETTRRTPAVCGDCGRYTLVEMVEESEPEDNLFSDGYFSDNIKNFIYNAAEHYVEGVEIVVPGPAHEPPETESEPEKDGKE